MKVTFCPAKDFLLMSLATFISDFFFVVLKCLLYFCCSGAVSMKLFPLFPFGKILKLLSVSRAVYWFFFPFFFIFRFTCTRSNGNGLHDMLFICLTWWSGFLFVQIDGVKNNKKKYRLFESFMVVRVLTVDIPNCIQFFFFSKIKLFLKI